MTWLDWTNGSHLTCATNKILKIHMINVRKMVSFANGRYNSRTDISRIDPGPSNT